MIVVDECFKTVMSKIQNNEYDLPGKQKCELLKVIRELIAQKNGIEYESLDCPHNGPCNGSCDICDKEIEYLDKEIRKKHLRGEQVSITECLLPIANMILDDFNRDAFEWIENDHYLDGAPESYIYQDDYDEIIGKKED